MKITKTAAATDFTKIAKTSTRAITKKAIEANPSILKNEISSAQKLIASPPTAKTAGKLQLQQLESRLAKIAEMVSVAQI